MVLDWRRDNCMVRWGAVVSRVLVVAYVGLRTRPWILMSTHPAEDAISLESSHTRCDYERRGSLDDFLENRRMRRGTRRGIYILMARVEPAGEGDAPKVEIGRAHV